MDLLLALITLGAVGYFLVWQDFLRPLLGLDRPQRVKTLPAPLRRTRRSRVRNPQNAANPRSAHKSAEDAPQNVPQNVPSSAAIVAHVELPAAAPGAMLITPNELQQLAAALDLRAKGSTEAEAIKAGFGASKGGGPAYRRAKELFDAATKAP